MEKIILIDAFAHIYRCFFAIRQLNNQRGEPVNALYGMARFLMNLEDDYHTRWGGVVFDSGKCTRRCEIHPGYKAQRPPMPDDMKRQISKIREWIGAFGWPMLASPGAEADDIIAGITQQRENMEVAIFSKDKDLTQLICDHVMMVEPGKNGAWLEMKEEQVVEKFGLPPQKIRDYLALIGDSADNIPGVDGVGPKTAVKLLEQFGSIHFMMQQVEAITNEKLRQKIIDAVTIIERNQSLVALDKILPEGWQGVNSIAKKEPDWNQIAELATKENFSSFIASIEKHKKEALKKQAPQQLMLF